MACIAKQKNAPDIETIIVDNNCTDDTVTRAMIWAAELGMRVQVVREERPGHSFARRRGVLAASGEFLCFLDDDNDPDPNYLERAEAIFRMDPQIVFCGGMSRFPEGYRDLPVIARYFGKSVAVGRQRSFDAGYVRPGEFLWGAGLCTRTRALGGLYARGFSPVLVGHVGNHFVSGDDGEIAILLQLDGGRGYYSSALVLAHRVERHRLRIAYFVKLFYGMGLARPALKRYQSIVNRRAINDDQPRPKLSSIRGDRLHRLRTMSLRDCLLTVALHIPLAAAFGLGTVRSRLTPLSDRAERQANSLCGSLYLESAAEKNVI